MKPDAVPIRSVAVVGAGTMGSGIAQAFAQAGVDVRLHDVSLPALQHAQTRIRLGLDRLVAKEAIDDVTRDATLRRISACDSLDQCATADLVIEAIAEDASAKRQLFAALDAASPAHTILASNTSSISITALGAATRRADRVLGMHFMNPVPRMPLVELVRGRGTSEEAMSVAREACRMLGKTAIESADSPGFIANRILMPMINEAIFALDEGVGTADAIDGVMTLGMKHPMGPLALADFIGLDVCLAIMDVMHRGLGDPKYLACPRLRRMVGAGDLGRKSGRGFYTYG